MGNSIKVKIQDSSFKINIYEGDVECTHENLSLVEPCCNSRGSSGYVECDCGGVREIICNNPDCTGIYEDFDDLFERAFGGGSECSV